MSVNGSQRQGGALISIDEAGGLVSVKSKDGKGFAQMSISNSGNGEMNTLDNNGNITGTLP